MKSTLLFTLIFSALIGIAQIPYGTYQIPFTPIYTQGGISVDLNDDQYSAKIAIGFPFRFFGTEYDSLHISSNGYITFRNLPGSFSQFSVANSIPTGEQGNAPVNSIFLTWCDLNPSVNGTISYYTANEAPNRIFIINYNNVPLFGCSTILYTGQLQLHETSNNIEMHITNKLFCNNQGGLGSYAIEGIQNATGTEGYAVPGRNNSGVWQAQNDAWRFDPDTISAPNCIMSGRVFADFNGNCMVDGEDYAVPGQTIIRDNGMVYTQTQANGIYSFEADTGSYTIGMNGLTANLPFATIVCPENALHAVSYTEAGSSDYMLDFYVHPDSACSDLHVNVSPMGPLRRCAGNDNHQLISITNHGLYPVNSYSITLTIPDSIYLYSTVPAYNSQNGNAYTWNFSDTLVFGEFKTIHLYDSVSCYATDGLSKCFQVIAEGFEDCNASNNQAQFCQIVNGSYDPNHIQVLQDESPNQYVYEWEIEENRLWYTYRIQFQNTGTAPAQTVVVSNPIPTFFDETSVQLLSSSHNAIMVNAGNGLIRFIHNQINLPDSSENFAESIGTIVYRIQATQELMPGQFVANEASIVFDVNPAIQTNEALVGIPEPTSISQVSKSEQLFYPNPASQHLNVNADQVRMVSIYNLQGQLVLQQAIETNSNTVSISQLKAGFYGIQLIDTFGNIQKTNLIVQ
ncbi:MAG: T9SS type A sorting domain-containing protein [Bacteroidia bacterium]